MSKKLVALISAFLVLSMMIAIILIPSVMAVNTTYYVDSADGNDGNSGTAEASAWRSLAKVNSITFQPGDQILFKAGCVWTGALQPLGSGANGSPIKIGSYGTGNKPIINGGGISAAIYFYNQAYWEISNLEITNDDNFGVNNTTALRAGIDIESMDMGTLNHFYITNCNVHDIDGHDADKGAPNAGIYVRVRSGVVPTNYNDIKIENNTLTKIDAEGIYTESAWGERAGVNTGWFCGAWYGWTNLVIRGNVLDDIGRDPIVTCVCSAPLVEYNVVRNFNMRSGDYAAGLWPFNCDNALFQFNEAYLGRTTKDGMGFDADYLCHNTIHQYEYSHDNEGGFMLCCADGGLANSFNDNVIVRYCISQNDRNNSFNITGPLENLQVYNNVVYTSPSIALNYVVFVHAWRTMPLSQYYYNNIFYTLGTGSWCCNLSKAPAVYDYNVMYGNHYAGEPPDAHKLTTNPLFVNPGGGGIGINTVDGYQLQAGSPCIGSGIAISNNGGRDYWGNVLYSGGPDRGAHEYSGGGGVTATPTPSAAVTSTSGVTATPTTTVTATATGPAPTPGENMILNPGFEEQNTYWTNLNGAGSNRHNEHTGTFSMVVRVGAMSKQDITAGVTAGASYVFKAWSKIRTAGDYGGIAGVYCYDSGGALLAVFNLTDITESTYTQKSVIFTAPAGTVKLTPYMTVSSAGVGLIDVDDLELYRN